MAAKGNRPEDTTIQTKVIELNLTLGSARVAFAIMDSKDPALTYYDKHAIAQLLEQKGHHMRALDLFRQCDQQKDVERLSRLLNEKKSSHSHQESFQENISIPEVNAEPGRVSPPPYNGSELNDQKFGEKPYSENSSFQNIDNHNAGNEENEENYGNPFLNIEPASDPPFPSPPEMSVSLDSLFLHIENQIRETFSQLLREKDDEIARLKQINQEQKQELDTVYTKLKQHGLS